MIILFMSRHSHWAKIKRAKGAEDAKKGASFTRLSRVITVAAKEKGSDPSTNFKLRLAIDAARAANMPKDTIDRAIARAAGGEEGSLEEISYEAMGPGGVALIIDAVTDNRNRTISSIKLILSRHGGSLAGMGSVKWQFEQRGIIRIAVDKIPKDHDAFELAVIDAGAVDVRGEEDGLTIECAPDDFERLMKYLASQNIPVEYSAVEWVSKTPVTVSDSTVRETLDNLYAALEVDDDIANYATNEI